jgi:hypothetical protein
VPSPTVVDEGATKLILKQLVVPSFRERKKLAPSLLLLILMVF